MFLRHLVPWPWIDIQVKFYGDRPRGILPLRWLNERGVAEYSDFGPIESRKQCKIGAKFANRKSYMRFRLVPKSVTLNDLERRDGPYFALFHRIW